MGLVQKEVQKVYMWKEPYTDYSAMQGPCPDGFHIPENSEVVNLRSILVDTLGVATGSIGTYLKMGTHGYRSYSNASVTSSGTMGYFWTCSNYSTNAYAFQISQYDMIVSQSGIRGNGYNIRAFKNEAVTPTTAWTKIFGTSIATGGIYWSSSLGLISISGDGTTWITIADKDLGAASVNGYGYYFQWGNNYGFASSGSVTTSSTTVNASSYGPGNYYSSSTFITTSSSPYNRDSSGNNNLRGGVTGAVAGGGDIQIRPTTRTQPYPLSEYTLNKSVSVSFSQVNGLWFSPDMDNVFLSQYSSYAYIRRVALSTPGDISTISTSANESYTIGRNITPGNIFIDESGTNLYVAEYTSSRTGFRHLKLGGAYSISALTFTEETSSDGTPFPIWVGNEGKNVYLGSYASGTNYIRKYTSSDAYGTTYSDSTRVTIGNRPLGIYITSDGLKWYSNVSGTIYAYDLSNAWDMPNGLTPSESVTVSGTKGLYFSSDFKKFWVTDGYSIYEYVHA